MKLFFFRWGPLGFLLWLVFWVIWELSKDAVFGWLNSYLARELGVEDFSIEQTFPLLAEYAPLAVAGVLALTIIWAAFRLGRSIPNQALATQEAANGDAEKAFIKVRNSKGLRLIGNLFRGNRTHVAANGVTDFQAVGNIHSGAETKPAKLPLLELRDKAVEGGWNFYGVGSVELLDFIHGLRQAALNEEITFWGRPDRNDFESLTKDELLQKIAGSHFVDFKIDVIGMASHLDGGPIPTENFDTRTSGLALGDRKECYRDLHVDRESALRWLSNDAEQYKGHNKPAMISLQDAASQLYTQARKISHLSAPMSEWEESEERTLDWWGGYIAVTKKTRLFGIRPPSNESEEIDRKEVENMHIEGGARELTSAYNEGNKYVELKILRSDLQPLLDGLKEEAE